MSSGVAIVWSIGVGVLGAGAVWLILMPRQATRRAWGAAAYGVGECALVAVAGPSAIAQWGAVGVGLLCALGALTIAMLTVAVAGLRAQRRPEMTEPTWWAEFESHFRAWAQSATPDG
jgi:hypothetical protein